MDLDELRAYRAETVWENAFRRPQRYALLCSREVSDPFMRRSADGELFDRSKR